MRAAEVVGGITTTPALLVRASVTALAAVLLAAVAAPAPLAAQWAPFPRFGGTVDAGGERRGGSWQGAGRVSADVAVDLPWFGVEAEGLARRDPVLGWRTTANARVHAATPDVRGFRLEGWAERTVGRGRLLASEILLHRDALRLSYARGRTGAFAALGRTSRDSLAPRDTMRPATAYTTMRRSAASVGSGVWWQRGRAVLTFRVDAQGARIGGIPGRDTAVVEYVPTDTGSGSYVRSWHIPGTPPRYTRWADAELRLSWSGSAATFDAHAGARPALAGDGATFWGGVDATLRLRPGLWLAAQAGTTPGIVPLAVPRQRHARIGLRIAPRHFTRPTIRDAARPAATAFELEAASDSTYVLRVTVPAARTVEVSADFTGWKPIPLRQVAPDRWETAVRLAPGAHRVNLRIDGGAWIVPPGAAPVEDDFGGAVGLVIAR